MIIWNYFTNFKNNKKIIKYTCLEGGKVILISKKKNCRNKSIGLSDWDWSQISCVSVAMFINQIAHSLVCDCQVAYAHGLCVATAANWT